MPEDAGYLCGEAAIYYFTPTFGAPSVPLNFNAVADQATQTVSFSWDAPNDNGGHTIIEYILTSPTQIDEGINPVDGSSTSAAGSYSVLGLTNGQQVTFTIQAYNGINGPPASVTITIPGSPPTSTPTRTPTKTPTPTRTPTPTPSSGA